MKQQFDEELILKNEYLQQTNDQYNQEIKCHQQQITLSSLLQSDLRSVSKLISQLLIDIQDLKSTLYQSKDCSMQTVSVDTFVQSQAQSNLENIERTQVQEQQDLIQENLQIKQTLMENSQYILRLQKQLEAINLNQ